MRGVLLAACGAALAVNAIAEASFTIQPAVLEGEFITNIGDVIRIDNIAINNNGLYHVHVMTNYFSTLERELLLAPGLAIVHRQNDPLRSPPNARLGEFNTIALNNLGQTAYRFRIREAGGGLTDYGIYAALTGPAPLLVSRVNDPAPGYALGSIIKSYTDLRLDDSGRMLVSLVADDPTVPSTIDRAIYRFTTDAALGGLAAVDVLAVEGMMLPGQTQSVQDLGNLANQIAMSAAGHCVFIADLNGDLNTDNVIYRWFNGQYTIIAQEGGPSPIAGRTWLNLATSPVAVNSSGDVAWLGVLSGATLSDNMIARNNQKIIQEGDAPPGITGSFVLNSFGTGGIDIDDAGNVLWYGDWNDPNTDIDTGLFLNHTLLVQEGVTVIDGRIVDNIRGVENGYRFSDNGRYIIFEAILVDGTEGAFIIHLDPATPPPCPADFNGDGAVGAADLGALLGSWGIPGCGGPPPPAPCAADLNGDGNVNAADLGTLLGAWGPCAEAPSEK